MNGSSWKKAWTTHTTTAGSHSFTVKMTKNGTSSYRVAKFAAAGQRTASSPTVKIRVKN